MRLKFDRAFGWLVVGVITVFPMSVSSTQQSLTHLNPVIEKLAQGQPVIGVSTTNLSLENARELARTDLDYVRVEMEHSPMSFDALRLFLLGAIDKAAILRKGNVQPDVATFVRLAPYGREEAHWVTKQALDLGVMGVIFSTVETKEQAVSAVRSMRYPQPRGATYPEPKGLRSVGPANAVWYWGVATSEYLERADVWPLNPAGDLLAIMLIESEEGVENVDEIASVPGVGMLYAGTGDLARSMGISQGPEVEVAVQRILSACLAHDVPCKINVSASNIEQRIGEGWRVLNLGTLAGGLTASVDAALRAGLAALRR